MNKRWANLLCVFVVGKEKRDALRHRLVNEQGSSIRKPATENETNATADGRGNTETAAKVWRGNAEIAANTVSEKRSDAAVPAGVSNLARGTDVLAGAAVSSPERRDGGCGQNYIEIAEEDKNNINLKISGSNNRIVIKKLARGCKGKIDISLAGNGCTLVFEEGIWVSSMLKLIIGQLHPNFGAITDTEVHIGRGTSFESCTIITYNSHARLNIGERCMFAYGITLFHTDAHPIYDLETKQIINRVDRMDIGRHVWVGAGATILKNAVVADECIIGWGSVVSGRFGDSHSVLAGNPARKVRGGYTGRRMVPKVMSRTKIERKSYAGR